MLIVFKTISESDNEGEVKLELTNTDPKREFVTVADGDGQQYVVLEVIQLEDGSEQQVAVVAPDYIEEEEEQLEDEDDDMNQMEHHDYSSQINQKNLERSIKLEKEVDACFGFDEEDEDEQEDDDDINYNEKVVLHLV